MAKEILIADSDKAEQEKFQQYFEATDYHLIFSESGEDALLRVKLFKPDMIIAAGKGLHEMGGLELCGVLKRDPEYKHIPFIIISGIFDEISEKDLKRNQADGVISKPLNEEEVLNLVDHLMEGGTIGTGEEGREEVLLDEMGEGEEEIIELLDVIEEPEPKMSIDDFITTEKEETLGDLAPLESWGKLEFEEKPSEKEVIEEIDLQLKREMPRKEAQPEEELFEKIELTEILEQVEQMKPSIEKEWPSEKEGRVFKEKPPQKEETVEKYLDLSEFETAFQDEVKTETGGLELESFPLEAPQKEISEEALLIEESVEEELKELTEEELPDEFLEEILREEEIRIIDETKEVKPEEVKPEEVKPEEVKPEEVKPEEIKP